MPGSLWLPFRQGDRSEYLANYILSALGTVVKVPREEDVGVDFHCTLARFDGKRVSFDKPFLVQIKSSGISEISYGGIDKNGRYKAEEVEWLFGQELPLLIGLVDKKEAWLKLYTTSNMWAARYVGGHVGEVILKMDVPKDESVAVPLPKGTPGGWPGYIGDGKRWEVPLGPPMNIARDHWTPGKR